MVIRKIGRQLKVYIDLPRIGKSEPISSSDKNSIAKFINEIIQTLNLEKIVLTGHDVGGMITYAFLKLFPEKLFKAVIMNTAVPRVEPCDEVKRNPYIWHFAFYAVTSLPKTLITGKQRILLHIS
jgi:pimeloyl-ACP methyl ester carboxylesterase